MGELLKVVLMCLPPWPSSAAAAAPAEAAGHGSWQRLALLADVASRSIRYHGSPCSYAAWSGTFPYPVQKERAGSTKKTKAFGEREH